MPMGPWNPGTKRAPRGVHVTVLKGFKEQLWRFADGMGRWSSVGLPTREDALARHKGDTYVPPEDRLKDGSVEKWRSYIE